MDFALFLQAIAALALVLGVMLVVFWFVKYCELKGCKNPFLKKLNIQNRLSVVEFKRVDAKTAITIVRCDDEEFIVFLTGNGGQLLKTKKVSKNV